VNDGAAGWFITKDTKTVTKDTKGAGARDTAEIASQGPESLWIEAKASIGLRRRSRDLEKSGKGQGIGRIRGPFVSFVTVFVSFVMNQPPPGQGRGRRNR
jgi:hypothetical protein